MLSGEIYAGGFALEFYDSAEFEAEDPNDTDNNAKILGRNLLRLLMMGWRENWTTLISWEAIKAVFISRDHQMTRGMRHAFQEGFYNIFNQLQSSQLTVAQHNQAQLFISNCLMFLPYADINPYESLKIPQWINDSWQLVEYKVVPIELTPRSGFSKLFLGEYDRVFAHGLEPINHPDAEPHLIFMGTTYPGGQGFWSTIDSDLEAFETAGKNLYRSGRENIKNWLDKQGKKTHVCGTSLGGALSLILAIDQGEKLSRVDALNPPGLHDPWWRKSRFDRWDELSVQPEVYIQRQGNDPVSQFGVWKDEWNLLHVQPGEQAGLNLFTDHALNYAGSPHTRFIGMDTAQESVKNERRNFWLYVLLRSMVYFFILLPFRYLQLPVIRLISDNKLQTLLMLPAMIFFGLSMPIASLPLVFAAITCVSYLLTTMVLFVFDQGWGRQESALTKLLVALSESSWATKAQLLLVAAGLLALYGLAPALLALPSVATLFIVLPLAIDISVKLINIVKTLLGINELEIAEHHKPEHARNAAMDIYVNTTEAEFTYKQIHDYYQAKRCVLKNKDFLPVATGIGGLRFFASNNDNGAKTKVQVLTESLDPHVHQQTLKLSASKAKIHDIKQTLQLTKLWGFHDPRLKAALQENEASYCRGKESVAVSLSC